MEAVVVLGHELHLGGEYGSSDAKGDLRSAEVSDERSIRDSGERLLGCEGRHAKVTVARGPAGTQHVDASYVTEVRQIVNGPEDVDSQLIDRLIHAARSPYRSSWNGRRSQLIALLNSSGFAAWYLGDEESAPETCRSEVARLPLTKDLRTATGGGGLARLVRHSLLDSERGDSYPLEHFESLKVRVDGNDLVLTGPSAWDAARRLVDRPYGQSRGRRVDTWIRPAAPAAAVITLLLLLLAIAFAWLHVTRAPLVLYAVLNALILGFGTWWARVQRVRIRRYVLAIAAPTIVVGFATLYGFMMLGPDASVVAPTAPRLTDAMLLSIAVATTGGFLDYELVGDRARFAALIEMILLVSLAGGTVYAVARQALRSLREIARPGFDQ